MNTRGGTLKQKQSLPHRHEYHPKQWELNYDDEKITYKNEFKIKFGSYLPTLILKKCLHPKKETILVATHNASKAIVWNIKSTPFHCIMFKQFGTNTAAPECKRISKICGISEQQEPYSLRYLGQRLRKKFKSLQITHHHGFVNDILHLRKSSILPLVFQKPTNWITDKSLVDFDTIELLCRTENPRHKSGQPVKRRHKIIGLSYSLVHFLFLFYQYVGLSVCQSTRLACLSASVSVRLSIYRNVCLPACLFICLSVHLSAGTFACLPVYLSVCRNVCLPSCLSVYLPVCLSFLLVWLSFFPSFYLFAYLPVRLPFCGPCLFIKVLSYRRVLLSWVFHNLPSATRTMLSKCTERPVLPSVIKSPLISWKILF